MKNYKYFHTAVQSESEGSLEINLAIHCHESQAAVCIMLIPAFDPVSGMELDKQTIISLLGPLLSFLPALAMLKWMYIRQS